MVWQTKCSIARQPMDLTTQWYDNSLQPIFEFLSNFLIFIGIYSSLAPAFGMQTKLGLYIHLPQRLFDDTKLILTGPTF